ncbi:MAG TPA: SrtB family sortase [Lachnospiraceae bacterium]|nr:SrtB family sortase [Lachnospiraceae bacterium]
MAEIIWTVEGRRFRNAEEYQAALRDKELIDSITGSLKLDNPKDVEILYHKLKEGHYIFESIVGRQFDDNIYELYQRIKQKEVQAKEKKIARKEKRKQQITNLEKMVISSKKQQKLESKTKLGDFDKDMQEQIIEILKKKERKRKILMAVCVFLCIISFGYLGAYYQVSAKSAREFEELSALKKAGAWAVNSGNKKVEVHLTDKDTPIPDILPEYKKIHQKNQKLIGWVKIDDTIIDYPVMQTVNNEYYLDHNFNQEEDRNGCIFMDYQCDVIKGCDNMILYGHHMKSGKMFGTLNKYSEESYYEEHPIIQFDTIYEKGKYQVMYVFRSKVYSEEDVTFKYYQFINAASEMEFNSYLNEMAALSLYDTGVVASYGDKLLTLSTCDYQEKKGRFVVVAKKIG